MIYTQLLPALDKICNELGIKLYLNNYHINHYSQICYVNRHTDSLVDGYVTILIFCNEYWDETWGGELKIYEEERSSIHKVVDFVPGRIIIFDSRIEHKVLPLTPSAKTDRFSIAIKALTDISHLSESEMGNLIQLGVA